LSEQDLGKAIVIRVSSLGDLVRLASSTAQMMLIMPIYRFKLKGKIIYAIQTIYKDYYKLYGLPIIYYYIEDGEAVEDSKAKYILIKVDETGEKIETTDKIRPGWIGIPIINLTEKPPFIPDDIIQ